MLSDICDDDYPDDHRPIYNDDDDDIDADDNYKER